jgi:hypothetical protein
LPIFQLTAPHGAEKVRPVLQKPLRVKTAKAYLGGDLSLRSLPESSRGGIILNSAKMSGDI